MHNMLTTRQPTNNTVFKK